MATALEPGMISALMEKLAAQAVEKSAVALEAGAKLIEDRAVNSVSARSHPLGTKTPATRGGPPAMISGTLAKSITHSAPEPVAGGWRVKVGMESGHTALYSRTPSSLVGRYLEWQGAGRSHVTYPFLKPAYEKVGEAALRGTFKAEFSRGWSP